jgi:hypothetical protein
MSHPLTEEARRRIERTYGFTNSDADFLRRLADALDASAAQVVELREALEAALWIAEHPAKPQNALDGIISILQGGTRMSDRHVCAVLFTREDTHDRNIPTTYRVTCTCGWQSGWTTSWRKSLDDHVYRLAASPVRVEEPE